MFLFFYVYLPTLPEGNSSPGWKTPFLLDLDRDELLVVGSRVHWYIWLILLGYNRPMDPSWGREELIHHEDIDTLIMCLYPRLPNSL